MEVLLAGLIVHTRSYWHDLAVLAVETPHFQHGFGLSLSESHLIIKIH